MPVTVSYPGVYVQEEASGARAIAGVATSVTMFIGMAKKGKLNTPIRILSFADFERSFGSDTGGELADQVSQFYLNGGATAWICRIADGALQAAVTLNDEQGRNCLTVTAADHGQEGNLIRLEIDYNTANPERTFNLTVFRSRLQDDGTTNREDEESFLGLSMNPNSGSFVETVINGTSALIEVAADTGNAPSGAGVSYSGLVLPTGDVAVHDALADLIATGNAIRISVDNNPAATAVLTAPADLPTLVTEWTDAINAALSGAGLASTVAIEVIADTVPSGSVTGGRLLRITSVNGPVVVSQAATNDASVALMLGDTAGGLEGDEYGDIRPAPTGVVARNGTSADGFEALRELASFDPANLTSFTLTDDSGDGAHTGPVDLAPLTVSLYSDGTTNSLAHVRTALNSIVTVIAAQSNSRWSVARHGLRLALTANYGGDNTGQSVTLVTGGGSDIGAAGLPFATDVGLVHAYNVAAYTVGQVGTVGGLGPFQSASVLGENGNAPIAANYDDAYEIIEREVDLFNIMVLPRAEAQPDATRISLWGPASAFCAKQRAFLLADPEQTWNTITVAESGVDALRLGVETRNTATYWPRLKVAGDSANGRHIDPSGSLAGLMARTDSNRGVWKAAAGIEATIRGVIGVERQMSDPENGVINPKALNAIRVFPAGVVSWGARTLVGFDSSGNVDDKYIPVRRTMLFLEESLYRGLRFAVFEPNDEPLWAQIRLAAGSFMSGLFRQGAFAGQKATDAYFVTCDSTTTTANDINLGIVNVIVGFAPLKPAEFVILTVTQVAGQVAV